jgi:signal transduction histidine kinase
VGRRSLRSISIPIILASTAVALAAALLVGWTLVFARNLTRGEDVAQNVWLLVLGVFAFVAIMSVLVMFAIFLAREILEVRRQDSFIDSVTHELKSPLASLKLGLQTMSRPQLADAQREELRTMMLGDLDRLSAFIDDVLQASRLAHAGRVGVTLGAVEVRPLVDEIVEAVRSRRHLPAEAIRIAVDPDLDVVTDRAALAVVLRNLVDNAVKYSGSEVDVDVRARREGGGVEIEVEDRGIGIPKKDLRRVFYRFYRVQGEGVRSRKGTGLGLFVVSALVRNLGGRVRARSDGPGRGSTLSVYLPDGPRTSLPPEEAPHLDDVGGAVAE